MKRNSFLIVMLTIMAFSSCLDNRFNNTTVNLASGYQLYEKNCSNCHQTDGTGLAQLYPTLVNSDFIKNNPTAIDSIIKYGQKGSIMVNGIEYNMAMPGNNKLSDFEIKQIASYVLIKFNKLDSLVN
ncbi:MAG: cytochrome c [Candidatus Methylacidiphilales bacterium]